MKKILLIEDDLHLRKIIADSLSTEYQVTACETLKETYDQLDNTHYDLALVDRLLPDGDSLELIDYLASTQFQTKIIVISSLSQSQEKIRGLEIGADDYLPKPFSLGELRLKVAKACHYVKTKPSQKFALGELTFDPSSGEVTIGAYTSTLRKKESDILACLFKYKNRVVSRETLTDEVWAYTDTMPTQTTLDVYIRRIRMMLNEYKSCIVTKRGFGYLLTDGIKHSTVVPIPRLE